MSEQYHMIVYNPDGIAVAHHYEDAMVDELADMINAVTSVAARQGFISTAEIVEAAEKIVESLKQKETL